MDIQDKKSYSNYIYKAIVVNSNTDTDPDNLGRVQLYIPALHPEYAGLYVDYMRKSKFNKVNSTEFNYFPWATTLVSDLQDGNIIYGGNINNDSGTYIVFGIDVYNRLDEHIAGIGGSNDITNLSGNVSGIIDLCMPIILFNEVGMNINAWPDNISDEQYTLITPYDKGGWSIGILQWHHSRAFNCLYEIAKSDVNWKSKSPNPNLDLVIDIENSLKANSDSKYKIKYQENYHPTVGTDPYIFITNMLGSDIGKSVQRQLASADTQNNISILTEEPNFINNVGIIIFLTDMMNQYGSSLPETIKMASTISKNTSLGLMSQLNELISWCERNYSDYATYGTRRNETYNYIENLYNQGYLNVGTLTDLTGSITTSYIPEFGEYLWPVPTSDKINCFWGVNKELLTYDFKYNSSRNFAGYSDGRFHNGVDIGPKEVGVDGDPVVAVGNGTVAYVYKNGRNGGGADQGNCIAIQMDKNNNHFFVYMHLCKPPEFNVGDRVKAGQTVGYMGTTGNSTGTHLHIGLHIGEVWPKPSTTSNKIDPLPYFGKRATT